MTSAIGIAAALRLQRKSRRVGAGKSTFLRLLAREETLDSGRILLRGIDITAADVTRLLRAVSARKPPVVMRGIEQPPFAQVPWLRTWGVRSALWLPLAI